MVFHVSSVAFDYTTSQKFAFYVDGEKIVDGDDEIPERYVKEKYNYAKVGYDKSGNVEFVSAYNLKNFLVVDKVDGDEVVGYAGEGTGGAFDADDATIVKDNKVISLDDLEQGDVLFFNKDANNDDGFAEVVTNTVSGEIDDVFSNSVRIDGKTYYFTESPDLEGFDVEYAEGAVYLNDDNETELIDSDAAEELQAAGSVTLYSDRAGNVVYIGGDTANVERNTVTSILTADINAYDQGNRDRLEVEVKFSTGEEKLFDVNLKDLKSIIIDGKTYDIDNDANNNKWTAELIDNNTKIELSHNSSNQTKTVTVADTKGDIVKAHLDNDRNRLEKLEFFENWSADITSTLEAGDSYAAGKKLNSRTVVFDASKFTNNAKDISTTTWGEYKGSDISDATVVYDKNDEAVGIVINDTTTDADVYEEAVITNVLRNTDNEIVEVTAFVSGEKRTIKVDEITADLERGNVAILVFNDKNDDLVERIVTTDGFASDGKLGSSYAFKGNVGNTNDDVNVGKREVKIGGDTYRLANDGLVIDATDRTDIKTKSLTDLRGKNNVTAILDEKGSRFVKFFVIGANFDGVDAATEVVSVANLDDITVDFGTVANDLNLPSTVKVTYDNGQDADVDVTWDTEDYDGETAGDYVITGELDLGTGVTVADGVQVEVKVTVKAEGEENVKTVADIGGNPSDPSNLGQFSLALSLEKLRQVDENVSENSTVIIKVGEEEIDLEYDAEFGFTATGITGYSEEELKSAVVEVR